MTILGGTVIVAETCHTAWVPSGDEHEFLVFLADSDEQPLGCLKTVSKLEVTAERWAALWLHPE